jgi:hypothetical protein
VKPQEAEEVKTEKNVDFALRVQSGVNMAATRAGLNALSYTEEVRDAVADFEKYSAEKIEKLEGQVTAGKLAVELADAVLTVLQPETKLIEYAAIAIGKELASHIYKKLTDALKKPVEDLGSTDTKSLKKAVSTLSQRTRDRAANIRGEVDEVMRNLTNPIVTKLQNGETLDGWQDAFAAEVYMANLDQIDVALRRRGVPEPKGNYGPVLTALTTAFEVYYIKATYNWEELMRMGLTEWQAGSTEATGGLTAEAKLKAAPFIEERMKERKSQ